MSIDLDTYIDCLPPKEIAVSKETLINVLDYSPNFKYNKETNMIKLRTTPIMDTISIDLNTVINKHHLPSHDKINEYINSHLKHIAYQTFHDNIITLRFTSECLCQEVHDMLTKIGINSTIEHENIKDRIMKSNNLLSHKEHHNPRKFSDNVEGGNRKLSAHKNSMSTKRFKNVEEQFGYRGKRSFNKYDEVSLNQYSDLSGVPLSKDYISDIQSKQHQYNFNDLSKIYTEMKLLKKFSFPKEWEKLELEEIMLYEPKTDLDHSKKQVGKSNFRERANTHVYEFKGNYYN
jgi:hypothetical protein